MQVKNTAVQWNADIRVLHKDASKIHISELTREANTDSTSVSTPPDSTCPHPSSSPSNIGPPHQPTCTSYNSSCLMSCPSDNFDKATPLVVTHSTLLICFPPLPLQFSTNSHPQLEYRGLVSILPVDGYPDGTCSGNKQAKGKRKFPHKS